MPDSLSTIWLAQRHTLAKHTILTTYLKAWVAIMSRQSERIGVKQSPLFVDGFAGPGVYEGGRDGSPILALKAIINHSVELASPIRFIFIEKDSQRCESLRDLVHGMKDETENSKQIDNIEIKSGECEQIIGSLIDDRNRESRKLGPALLFLDQFGYSDVSMELIRRVMSQQLCEVFSYLNWDNMNRFIKDETKWSAISRAYGGDEWKEVVKLEHKDRSVFMLSTYRNALKTKAASRYVWHFAMCDRNDKLIYWLFFCTNSLRGLEEMKKAMWKVDKTGGFRFSDKDDPSQFSFFRDYEPEMLAEELSSRLRGKTFSAYQVKEFVLTETPAYLYKAALKMLENEGLLKVDAPPGRKAGRFPDNQIRQIQIKFLSSPG